MKGCFVLHRRFAYIGHYIAQILKEEFGVDQLCGIAFTRPSLEFLHAQKDVCYSTLLFDEEIHARYKHEVINPAFLDQLEKDYGIPYLWPFLAVDRVVMSNQLVREYPYDWPRYSHEDMQRLLQVYAKTLIAFLDAERPDFIFFGPIGSVGAYLLWRMAKKRGIKTFTLMMSSTRNRYVVSETFDTFSGVEERFRQDRSRLLASSAWKDAEAFVRQFREQPTPYYDKSSPSHQPVTRFQQFRFLHPKNAFASLRVFVKNLREHLIHKDEYLDYSYINPWTYLMDLLKRKCRNLIGLNDLYDPFTPDDEDFVFFPLHSEPEIALLLLAPYQIDQINLIRQIARSLPVRYKLYVKDHPEMAQYRTRAFYRAIKKNPNVRLIDPAVSSFLITPRAKLITTITGSVGWEALLLKKPVISFGHYFYNALSMVSYCGRMEELPLLVKQRLENHTHDEGELLAYVAALFQDSAELNLHHLWLDEPDFAKKKEGVRPVVEILAKKLCLTKQG